ncbi:MAG: tRNA (5-methylaminomethyl-2-thiouridine)(34)-methyltransferase MnmD [Crocinitomicaceae bacterium]|jgi:tRNA U34 5-methylaminomethyl-2-thiouridine-forming methyltransferase MnmC|tara:strand:+ start:54712 stop:55377 length:666 start_codon:yes stop_codon:yes gene_type:complete
MKRELRQTEDGSNTIYVPALNEHYHSFHGALQESNHVFLKNGFYKMSQSPLRILEVGFGTGLNSLLTACASFNSNLVTDYVGVEAYPVTSEMMLNMEYPSVINQRNAALYSSKIISAQWGKRNVIHSKFSLTKIDDTIQNYHTEELFNLIYFDAFGPRVQGDMWQKDVIQKMFDFLAPQGTLVTYCAMGQFKRDLRDVGFEVSCFDGPPGKREMVSAQKLK